MIVKPLTEYCTLNMGQSPDSKTYNTQGNGLPFYQGNADFGETHPVTRVWCSAPVKVAEDGDILISVRAPIGAMNMAVERCCIGRGLAALTPIRNKCSKQFLYYALQSKVDSLIAQGTGSTFKAISKKVLEATCIPSYSTIEQEQIAETIGHIDNTIAARRNQLALLDQLVKSRFIELFGDPVSNPMKWDICQLEECLDRIDNGKSFICSDKPRTGDNPAILKLSAATYGDYRPNENKALLDESLFVEISEVHAGDLLFTRKNTPELVGMAAYVQNTPPKLMLPDLIFRLVPNERVNAVFLWKLINCKEFRPVIQAISGGSAKSMSNISKERLGKIKVICPPRELQDSLIPFVEQTDKSKYYSALCIESVVSHIANQRRD